MICIYSDQGYCYQFLYRSMLCSSCFIHHLIPKPMVCLHLARVTGLKSIEAVSVRIIEATAVILKASTDAFILGLSSWALPAAYCRSAAFCGPFAVECNSPGRAFAFFRSCPLVVLPASPACPFSRSPQRNLCQEFSISFRGPSGSLLQIRC